MGKNITSKRDTKRVKKARAKAAKAVKVASRKQSKKIKSAPKSKGKSAQRTMATLLFPNAYQVAEDADKMLYDSRNNGDQWKDIHARWLQIRGTSMSVTTLRQRYRKMKRAWEKTLPGDVEVQQILSAQREVLDQFNKEKWENIAAKMLQSTGRAYTAAQVQDLVKDRTEKTNTETNLDIPQSTSSRLLSATPLTQTTLADQGFMVGGPDITPNKLLISVSVDEGQLEASGVPLYPDGHAMGVNLPFEGF